MKMSTVCLLLVPAATATKGATGCMLFAGSGGCDVSDIACVDAPAPEMWSYMQAGGSLTPVHKLKGGSPSWVRAYGNCVVATVTGASQVSSYTISSDGHFNLKSTVDFAPASNPVFIDRVGAILMASFYHGDPPPDKKQAGVGSMLFNEKDCSLTKADFVATTGKSVIPGRQKESHLHSINALPTAGRLSGSSSVSFFGCDLGADAIVTYGVDSSTGKISEQARFKALVGSGPRHMAFHPGSGLGGVAPGAYAYTVMEMANYVGVYRVENRTTLVELQRTSTLPARKSFSGFTKAAEILITPDGKQLLVSNRGFGPDSGSVTVFPIDQATGKLDEALAKTTQIGDTFPRGMELLVGGGAGAAGAGGHTLMVAGQSGGMLQSFHVGGDGRLNPAGTKFAGPPNPTTVAYAC